MYEYKAKIERVIDLDTYDCSIDLGFNIKIQHRIRLLGVDGFESKEIRGDSPQKVQKGKEGKAILIEWLTGKEIIVQTVKDENDKYGRFLATVIFQEEHGTVNLGEWILSNGYGVPTNANGKKLQ